MHAQITIRPAVPVESPALLRLIQWAMQVYAANSGITASLDAMLETEDDLRRHIIQNHVLVAEHKGELIGTVRLIDRGNGHAYFSRFAVHPHLQQTGVGKMIYQAAEDWLLAQHFQSVELHTALTNEPLVSFYRARGFSLVETDHSRGYPRGLFRKDLQQ